MPQVYLKREGEKDVLAMIRKSDQAAVNFCCTEKTMSKKQKKHNSSIPDRQAWGSLDDLDVKYAFKLYGGKSIKEVTPDFIGRSIDRVDELRFAPWAVFSYYIFWFVEFLTSDESRGEADCASCFLHLVLEKAHAEPQFSDLYPHLKPAVDTVAGRQEFFEAPVWIYGSFSDYKQEIEAEVAKR